MTRVGYYVEGKYFDKRKHQAIAFATNRASEYGRNVYVQFVGDSGQPTVIGSAHPTAQEMHNK